MKYDIKKCIITLFSKVVEVTAGVLRWVISENEWNSGKSHEKVHLCFDWPIMLFSYSRAFCIDK